MKACPALFVSAPASGQGKTTVTAALAHYHRQHGRCVRIFKTGPDFLDPMILERACGHPVYQLDLWMGGEAHCRQLLYEAAAHADLILIEGVMGLFDGDRSSADLASLFDIPVLAVIDGSAMAQTFGAIAHGLANYRPTLPFAGVFANRVASESHFQMLAESLSPRIPAYGWLVRDPNISLPERHLGLIQASELTDLDTRIALAAATTQVVTSELPPPVTFTSPVTDNLKPMLAGTCIAVAQDAAFAFLYRSNLELLQTLGAKLIFFSPLNDHTLPQADALYLPGGYPELYMEKLSSNSAINHAIVDFHAAGKPIVAECGGMLYLLESLTDMSGKRAPMLGLLSGHAVIQERLANIGLHSIELPEGELRGHGFHYARMDSPCEPFTFSQASRHHGRGEPIYRQGRLTASFMHYYFASNPHASARLFLP